MSVPLIRCYEVHPAGGNPASLRISRGGARMCRDVSRLAAEMMAVAGAFAFRDAGGATRGLLIQRPGCHHSGGRRSAPVFTHPIAHAGIYPWLAACESNHDSTQTRMDGAAFILPGSKSLPFLLHCSLVTKNITFPTTPATLRHKVNYITRFTFIYFYCFWSFTHLFLDCLMVPFCLHFHSNTCWLTLRTHFITLLWHLSQHLAGFLLYFILYLIFFSLIHCRFFLFPTLYHLSPTHSTHHIFLTTP